MAKRFEKLNQVQINKILKERIEKEQRHQRLHTEFSINPKKKIHILPEKPMSRKQTEPMAEDLGFTEAVHKARLEPTKKYPMPMTESQEIGWVSGPLIPPDSQNKKFNFHRVSTEVTKHTECVLKKGII